ncbi:fibronectin type III domain-containing protein [Candidatus Falkowbacteria bacterium]|nr:fibronectin type III domain-containing protein [Candidatus Falkowbacteria bacterium]
MAKLFAKLSRNENFIIKGLVMATLVVLATTLSSTMVFSEVIEETTADGYGFGYSYDTFTFGYHYSSSIPSAVTTFSCSSASSTSVTCNWVAGSGAADSTSLQYFYRYYVYYSTDSTTANKTSGTLGATITDSATTSATISSLTAGTTYYFRAYLFDSQFNHGLDSSLAAATPGSTSSSTGGGGGGAGSTYTPPIAGDTSTTGGTTTPTTPSTTVTSPTDVATLVSTLGVTRDTVKETSNAKSVVNDVKEFKVSADAAQQTAMTNFVTYGISTATQKLGSGERRAVLRDYLETVGRANVDWADVERMTNGQKPVNRNLSKEQAQVGVVLNKFVAMVGHKPNFKNNAEDLAWNTMMYRIRFTRDLNTERSGIKFFKSVFGKNPTSPLDWSVVRGAGYALGK